MVTKNSACTDCKGTGAKNGTSMTSCATCGGNGKVRETRQSIMGSFTTVRECNVCNGLGEIPKEKCPHCAGAGIKRSQEEITIKVPAGIENGEVIRMTGRGEAIPNGQPGDLYIKVHVEADKYIRREGATLITTLPIKLTDAILGSTYKVATMDGSIDVKIPAGISHGELLRVKDKGVPTDRGRGDFMIKISIEIPKKLSRTAEKLIKELREEGV
ncbi:MAG: DnaJ C-terminal domain-containing protein [Candidatus Paceibacterota bacterium]